MRFFAQLVVFLFTLVAGVAAVDLQKHMVVTYPEETPDWVVDEAKNTIRNAGGVITHEYNLIKGFAAKTSVKVVETVKTMGSKYNARVEEDKVVSVQ